MNLYYSLLKAFLNKELYIKYKDYVNYTFLKENYPEVSKLYKCLDDMHSLESEVPKGIPDLELSLFTLYPQTSVQDFAPIFSQLEALEVNGEQVARYCQGLKERAYAARLAGTALAVAEGSKPFQDLQDVLSESESETTIDEDEFSTIIPLDIEKIYAEEATNPGLTWPLESLNKNLGDLKQGSFGFVFARPETGKTTFLTTVVPHFATQKPGHPILWFCNEEKGSEVMKRLYSSALGMTALEVYSDLPGANRKFKEKYGDNVIFDWDTGLTKQKVEKWCRHFKPSLIIYDQIDQIKGFHKEERNDLDLKAIYVWARQLAQQYAPTIAICQAGLSGDGKRWLSMGDVDNSKTGKQGAADWILGIGKVFDEGLEGVRYLHLSKNKLKGTHSKWEVRIKTEQGRYEDF